MSGFDKLTTGGEANHVRWSMCVLFLLLTACAATEGRIIYVDTNAVGANDGSSWADAFNYLQDALITASAGDEIRVAQGTYKPNEGILTTPGRRSRTSGEADREASFILKSDVTIKGGFAGFGEPDPNAYDSEVYKTILSGDLNDNDDDTRGPWHSVSKLSRSDNSLHVVVSSYKTDPTAVLDGFTIVSAADSGMVNNYGRPRVMNCTFRKNFSNSAGGGLSCVGGDPTVSHCTFQENHAWIYGGAIYASGGELTLVECRFLANSGLNKGGGISSQGCNLSLANCTFEQNAAERGGGLANDRGGLVLTTCGFDGNLASIGGAVDTLYQEAAVLSDCTFKANQALYYGGTVNNQGGPLHLDGCVFSGNSANVGGGLSVSDIDAQRNVTIEHCLFTGNRASSSGGAIYGSSSGIGSWPVIANCTFADNWAPRWATLVWPCNRLEPSEEPDVIIANSILWDGGQSIYLAIVRGRSQEPDLNAASQEVAIVYSNVRGGWPGEGNIDIDPCFAKVGYWDPNGTPEEANDDFWVDGDYHLKSQAGRWDPNSPTWVADDVTSPCIDAGDMRSPIGLEPFPNGGIVNMGAYGGTTEASKSYFGKPVCEIIIAGDINGDCKVDFADLYIMIYHWMEDDAPVPPPQPTPVRR